MLFSRLLEENAAVWDEYLHHDFVRQLEAGTLEWESFLFYLKQDYIFLINYAKAYARLALNADTAEELRFAMRFQNYIIQGEIELHKSILDLGVKIDELGPRQESLTNLAYTRYVLSVGERGDFLDMLTALSACAIGYGYIGREIRSRLDEAALANHPYKEWILTYSGEDFLAEIRDFEDFLNRYTPRVDEVKFKKLSEIFHNVVRCEVAFWQHGLEMKLNL